MTLIFRSSLILTFSTIAWGQSAPLSVSPGTPSHLILKYLSNLNNESPEVSGTRANSHCGLEKDTYQMKLSQLEAYATKMKNLYSNDWRQKLSQEQYFKKNGVAFTNGMKPPEYQAFNSHLLNEVQQTAIKQMDFYKSQFNEFSPDPASLNHPTLRGVDQIKAYFGNNDTAKLSKQIADLNQQINDEKTRLGEMKKQLTTRNQVIQVKVRQQREVKERQQRLGEMKKQLTTLNRDLAMTKLTLSPYWEKLWTGSNCATAGNTQKESAELFLLLHSFPETENF